MSSHMSAVSKKKAKKFHFRLAKRAITALPKEKWTNRYNPTTARKNFLLMLLKILQSKTIWTSKAKESFFPRSPRKTKEIMSLSSPAVASQAQRLTPRKKATFSGDHR